MPQAGKRTLAIALVSIFSVATAIVAARAQSPAAAPQSSAPGSVKLAEQQFKNIKVFKGIPADQVIPAMEFITASLGVECEFCHVRQEHGMAFDKDDKKPKEVARKMIEMMTAINKDNFEGKREVTCNTCHHGAAHPVGHPARCGGRRKASDDGPRQKAGCFAAFGRRRLREVSERVGRRCGDPENYEPRGEGHDQRRLAISTSESKSLRRLPTSVLRRCTCPAANRQPHTTESKAG